MKPFALLLVAVLAACSSPQTGDGATAPEVLSVGFATAPSAKTAVASASPISSAPAVASIERAAGSPPGQAASASASASATATLPVVPTDRRLVGSWERFSVKLTFNSKGRVRMGISPTCVGSYFLKGDTVEVKYDPGARGCTWDAPASFTLKEPMLVFPNAEYKRVDKNDDASF